MGLVLAGATVLSAAILVRAWAGRRATLVMGLALLSTSLLLGRPGPGGDTLVPAETIGYAWYASVALVGVAALLPRKWFSDSALGRSRVPDAEAP